MSSDAPHPSWHPALMPNSDAEAAQSRREDAASSPPQDDPAQDQEPQPPAAGEPPEQQSQAVPPSAGSPPAESQPEPADPAGDAASNESSTASKHFSTTSFARTVSHEVSFTDDDEPEWSPSRSGPDPLKFLPESDRTNSFPPVCPSENDAPQRLETQLPSNQAEDLIREIEREEEAENAAVPRASAGSGTAPDGPGGQDSRHYIGGDYSGTPQEASDARFEEGLPLVPSARQDDAQQRRSNQGAHHDFFGDDAAEEEDDFFSKVRAGTDAKQDDFEPGPVERKSTMDVLKSLDMGPAGSHFVPLEEMAEEEEEEEKDKAEGDAAQPPEKSESPQDEPKAEEAGEDLDAKWKAMFADDDDEDFLLDTETETKEEVDAAAFLGSDDEGLLLEDEEVQQPDANKAHPTPESQQPAPGAPATQPVTGPYPYANQTPAATATTPATNPYLPSASPAAPVPPANPYLPTAPAPQVQPPTAAPFAAPPSAPPAPARYGYGAPPPPPPPPPETKKAQSFVDKSKGGYTSPYDLPMEVVKVPKRRTSTQPPQRNTPAPGPSSPAIPPPPRSASWQSHPPPPPPSGAPSPGMAPPASGRPAQGPPSARKTPQDSFFEELPVTTKPRPASLQSHRSLPSPSQPSPYGSPQAPPPQSAPPSVTSHPVHPPGPSAPTQPEAGIAKLVAPPPVNPYASLSSASGQPPAPPPAASTRYSPAPPGVPQAHGAVPAPASTRYSPAPTASRPPSAGYGPVPAAQGAPILPHQPRTSSPLAHFEISHEKTRAHAPPAHAEGGLPERRSSSSAYEPRLQKAPSLPPTREVEEEETPDQAQASPGRSSSRPEPTSPPESRYAPPPPPPPPPPPQGPRQTPPPSSSASGQAVLSPPKRAMSSHSPLAPSHDFAPPPRSQTQSPGSLYGNRAGKPVEAIPRPSSVHDLASPRSAAYPATPSTTSTRPRGFSLNLNVIPPTDGREHDPLQRWRGAPLISWGVGGTFVTMFPKEVPRYGMNQSVPAVVRSPGDVKVKSIKDIISLEERLAKFPGPLKGKSKKKETIAWLTTGIETLERDLPNTFLAHSQPSHEDKRAVERLLLWKILRLFVEHDGVLEGNPAVVKAARDILIPAPDASADAPPYVNGAAPIGLGDPPAAGAQSDAVSSSTVEQIRHHLLNGDCEKAVWTAADQRLWGHALLISNALAPTLYRQVAQEFVKKEVNLPGHNNESLAALYEVLCSNHEESVDELVPVHARAGLQLVAKDAASGPSKDALEGLDRWRETLSLILSNRTADDARAINSLGVLLSSYGRAEAAHICFMFARSHTIFGGLDDPRSHFVLVGSDHKKQAEQFAKEVEPLLLSEVYEYGQSLAGGSNVPITNPHLAAYKLQHALVLAEYGYRDKALQYCDAIAAAITSQTRRSPYHHPILENAVEDLMRRLKQAPKEESNSWIPKPSMNKVSDTMWSRFNKFVSGEDESSAQGSPGEGETGPFARVPGGTPTISRTPSVNNLETFGATVPSYGVPAPVANGPVAASAPPTRAASRYAPAGAGNRAYNPTSAAYAPRSSSEMNRGSFELPRRSLDMQSGHAGTYSPIRSDSPAAVYTPHGADYSSPQNSPYNPASRPPQSQASTPYHPAGQSGAPANGGSPGSRSPASATGNHAAESSGYQPPSYGYEPPSLTPYEPPAEENKDSSNEHPGGNSYEPPSYQPYTYEPPSYEPGPEPSNDGSGSDEESKPKPKKKGIMYDDDDDFPLPKPAEKTKEEKDRENEEMFRRIAEEDAKRAEAAKQTKKGWGFASWFGVGSKKDTQQESTPNKPIRAKLGEPNSFYYDPELKRWVNKNASAEETAKKATPPPPRATPRSASSSPAPPAPSAAAGPPRPPAAGAADAGRASAPPPGPVAMLRSASSASSASAPPQSTAAAGSRPATTLSNSSSIDDLLSSAGPRKPGAKKPRKGARYVDVMSKP